MMSEQYTQGRLECETYEAGGFDLYIRGAGSNTGNLVVASRNRFPDRSAEMHANARRLVACWNALEDLPQSALDGGWTRAGLEAYGLRLEAQRDELLAALREIAEASFDEDVTNCARAAIAKVEGGAA